MQTGVIGVIGAMASIASLLGGGAIVSEGMDDAVRQTQVHVISSRFQQMEAAVELARLRMGRDNVPAGDMTPFTPKYLKYLPISETVGPEMASSPSSRPRLSHDLADGTGPVRYIVMPLGNNQEAMETCVRIGRATGRGIESDPNPKDRTGCSRMAGGWSAWRRLS
jgi:hypothetical protein